MSLAPGELLFSQMTTRQTADMAQDAGAWMNREWPDGTPAPHLLADFTVEWLESRQDSEDRP